MVVIDTYECTTVPAELPIEFPDGTTPVTCRISVYDSSPNSKVGVGSLLNKALAPPLPSGSLYMEEVHVKVNLFLAFYSSHIILVVTLWN